MAKKTRVDRTKFLSGEMFREIMDSFTPARLFDYKETERERALGRIFVTIKRAGELIGSEHGYVDRTTAAKAIFHNLILGREYSQSIELHEWKEWWLMKFTDGFGLSDYWYFITKEDFDKWREDLR